MPRKDRPAPLNDSIFKAKLGQADSQGGGHEDVAEEAIPVHNTFIQFGASEVIDGSQKKGLTTAPAWVGPSFQSIVNSAVQSAIKEPEPPQLPDGSAGAGASEASSHSPDKLGSPKKVPVMRYSLSASSARAAGLPGNSAVVASYQLDRPGSGLATATTQDAGGEKCGEDEDGEDDDEEGESGDERPRPTPVPPGELPSLGSAKHAEGLCKRCCFFPKGRCLNGHDCEFCHYEHEKRKRKKKKKSKQKEGSGSEADEVSTPSGAMQQPSTGDSLCAPASLGGLPLRPPPPLDPAPPCPVDPALFGAWDAMMWGAPQIDAQTLRSVAGLPLTAPPAMPPQGIPPPCELPMVSYAPQAPTQPAPGTGGDSTTNFASGYGAAIATAAFVLDGSSPNADRNVVPGAAAAAFGAFGELKVPTYTPLPADNANMWAYAAAASGLQANGTVPPAPPPVYGRPPPR